jgi:hypothetical protein
MLEGVNVRIRNWPLRALALGAVAALVLGACGGDDDDNGAADTTETTADSTAGADSAAFCDTYAATNAKIAALDSDQGGDPAAAGAALDAAEKGAPSDISTAVKTMVATGREQLAAPPQEGGPPDIPPAEYFDAAEKVGAWAADNCDFTTMDVTAKNYEFEGLEDVSAGTTLVQLTNEGTEFHEIVLMHIADGETRPLDELLKLPPEEVGNVATEVGGATFAPPSAGNATTVDLEPGRYAALCFVPVGATPEALQSGQQLDENNGHFMHGMVAEFQVS